MADFAELSTVHRLQMAAYRWRRVEPLVWAQLAVPVRQARIALVTTAGLYRQGTDAPFRKVRGGDYGFRVLPDGVKLASLALGQTSTAFDREPAESDRNVALPLERLHELVRCGEVGAAAPRHLSFNGSISAPGRLIRESAPEAATLLRADGVQGALLVPV